MLKKIFAVFFAGMFFVAGAGATVDARTRCYETPAGDAYVYDTDVKPEITADYAIFFDNDESDIPDVCATEVQTNVIDKLKANAKDIETVLLFGSADSTGNSKHNAELAQKRVNTVNELLQNAAVPVCEYNSSRCARISMGDSFNSAVGDDNRSYNHMRAVFMFVIYKNAQCTTDVIDALAKLVEKVSDADVQTKLKTAQQYCNTTKKDNMLLQSQYNVIMDAINVAIQKYPDAWQVVPENLSATILADGIIAVRESLAASASVWRTDAGKFNYARLASDSIAGVVLGTAGGIITSNVVKKNQIKSGFDDVMCTVGGQDVAGWGDEFRVGVR